MKTISSLLLVCLIVSCKPSPCPPNPADCSPCSSVLDGGANPAKACRSQVAGCDHWGPIANCSSNKCSAECKVLGSWGQEPCLSCLKKSCSSELSACLADK